MSDFCNSLYKIVFERTKKTRQGKDMVLARLPQPFARGYQFIDLVDMLRHSLGGGHLMDTFRRRNGQMTKVKMFRNTHRIAE
jgi:hypothetical protein